MPASKSGHGPTKFDPLWSALLSRGPLGATVSNPRTAEEDNVVQLMTLITSIMRVLEINLLL
jgi:hypothetical protein